MEEILHRHLFRKDSTKRDYSGETAADGSEADCEQAAADQTD